MLVRAGIESLFSARASLGAYDISCHSIAPTNARERCPGLCKALLSVEYLDPASVHGIMTGQWCHAEELQHSEW
jgi:hypothetical protein